MSAVVVAPVAMLLLAILGATLEKAYFYVPQRELVRRAARGDHISAALARTAGCGGELRLLLIGLTVLLSAGGLVWLTYLTPWFVSGAVVVFFIVGVFFWLPRTRLHAMDARLAAWCAPAFDRLLTRLQPVMSPVTDTVRRAYRRRTHTGLFELADVSELFERQMHQRDNRISPVDLARMQSILSAGIHKVHDNMIPAKKMRAVDIEDDISPVLIDELHRSGQTLFPVYEGKPSNIVGTLSLERIADVHQHGNIGDNIDRHLAYIHEDDSLERALSAFYITNQLLLIVVNDTGKYVGTISLTSILHKLFGEPGGEAFDEYDDREAVARRHAGRQKA